MMKEHLENITTSLQIIEKVARKYDINIEEKEKIEEYKIVYEDFNDSKDYDEYYSSYRENDNWIFLKNETSSENFIKIKKIKDEEETILGGFSYLIMKTDSFKFIVINSIILQKKAVEKNESDEVIYSDYVDSAVYAKINDRLAQDAEGINADAVFFEFYDGVNNRFQAERLLHGMGAKWIPFNDYGQLTKSPNQKKLLCFPELVGEVFLIKRQIVKCFLMVTYPEIVNENILDEKLRGISYDESEFIYLNQIPIKEEPKVNFKRASICLELLVDDDYLDKNYLMDITKEEKYSNVDVKHNFFHFKNNQTKNNVESNQIVKNYLNEYGYCLFTHSYETDLFSYKYQNTPPYYTKNYGSKKFEIEFSKKTPFISEGRKEEFYNLNPNVVKMQGFANYTYFFNSKVRVWHIVITPSDENGLNELEIIQITKYFAGLQEAGKKEANSNDNKLITFKYKVKNDLIKADGIESFFSYLTGIKFKFEQETSFKSLITSGIVAIDMNFNEYIDIEADEDKDEINAELREKFNSLYNFIQKKEGNLETQNPTVASVFKALCGITLGIFDFARMGIEEISDTLAPREKSITPSSFLTINRGVLTSFALGDDVFNSAHKTLGMNPYLMIPSAVLAHNDYVSRDAESKLNDAWVRCDAGSEKSIKVRELIEKRNQVDDLINDDILANVFQYPTEQELYTYGMKHRGIQERIEEVRAKLIQLDKIIEQKLQQKNALNEKVIQLILTFLSLLQIASFCADFISLSHREVSESKEFVIESSLQIQILFVAAILFAIILCFVFKNSPIKQKRSKK